MRGTSTFGLDGREVFNMYHEVDSIRGKDQYVMSLTESVLQPDFSTETVEGMQAFMKRHRRELDGRRPFVLNLEVVGSGRTTYLEGEGFLRRYPYHQEAVALAAEVASEPPFTSVNSLGNAPFATDALIATRYGVPAITVASLNDEGYVPHYHWPSDTPESVDLRSVESAYAFCHRLIERLAEETRTEG